MGSKFCNINVKTADFDAVKAVFPDFTVIKIADGWVTAVSDRLQWGETQGPARRASGALPCPVVSLEYFDDDYLELAVFLDGKRAARHVPAEYEGFPRSPGSVRAWSGALGLGAEDVRALRVIFKEPNPEAAVRLLEGLLGCPLWVDEDTAGETKAPGREFLEAYLARRDAESRIRNRTRLTLLDGLEGEIMCGGYSYPLLRREGAGAAYWDVEAGKLRRVCPAPGPGGAFRSYSAWPDRGRAEGAFLVHLDRVERDNVDKNAVCAVSDGGQVLDEFVYDSPGGPPCCCFLDGERIVANGICRNIRTHSVEWSLGIRDSFYGVLAPLSLSDGRLVFCYDAGRDSPQSVLVSVDRDGVDRRSLRLRSVYHWQMPLAVGDRIYLGCERTLTCCSSTLEILWKMPLDRNVFQGGTAFWDAGTIYMFTYDCVAAIDPGTRSITHVREIDRSEDCYLVGVLPGVGPIVSNGGSALQAWDRELRPVSRHRMRGQLLRVLALGGRTYILSGGGDSESMTVRLYELSPLRPSGRVG